MGNIPNRAPIQHTLMSAVGSNTTGTSVNISAFRNLVLSLVTSGTATITVKIQGSSSATEPAWGSAASATNAWTFLAFKDLLDPTSFVAGGTGIAASGTDLVKNLWVDNPGLTWLNVVTSGFSAGTVSVVLTATLNA